MEILIFSALKAMEHVPENSTYAVRIIGHFEKRYQMPLKESPNYLHIATYDFDDNDEWYSAGPTTIDDKIAGSIITDFRPFIQQTQTLLVHCQRGQNRSPAVAIALNEVFSLGHDTKALMAQYPEYNSYVYRVIVDAGKRPIV